MKRSKMKKCEICGEEKEAKELKPFCIKNIDAYYDEVCEWCRNQY